MVLKFTTTSQAAVMSGVKVLVYGRSGVGKTVLCSTAPTPFIGSAESGILSLRNTNIPMAQLDKIEDVEEFYNWMVSSAEARQFQTFCLDSITEIAEQVLSNAKRSVKDPRQAYGELIDRMSSLIRKFRDIQGPNIYFSAKMEPMKDEMTGITKYSAMMPGKQLGASLPYFFDEVFRLDIGKDKDGKEFRFLQTQPDMQYEAKDRSGALAGVEPPDLSYIFSKIHQGAR